MLLLCWWDVLLIWNHLHPFVVFSFLPFCPQNIELSTRVLKMNAKYFYEKNEWNLEEMLHYINKKERECFRHLPFWGETKNKENGKKVFASNLRMTSSLFFLKNKFFSLHLLSEWCNLVTLLVTVQSRHTAKQAVKEEKKIRYNLTTNLKKTFFSFLFFTGVLISHIFNDKQCWSSRKGWTFLTFSFCASIVKRHISC